MQEAARLYNLPYETLRRRVVEKVGLDCRSGPSTVLTEYEELAFLLCKDGRYRVGLSLWQAVVFKIAEGSGRKHPLRTELLVVSGLMVLDQDILSSLYAPHNHCLMHMHLAPTMKSSLL